MLDALLYRGELPRSEVADVLGTSTRTASRVVSALIDQAVITSDTPNGDLRITFPARLAPRWMPGLFPEHPG